MYLIVQKKKFNELSQKNLLIKLKHLNKYKDRIIFFSDHLIELKEGWRIDLNTLKNIVIYSYSEL